VIELLAQAAPPVPNALLTNIEAAFPPLGPLQMQAQTWAVASMPALVALEFGAMTWDNYKRSQDIQGVFMGIAGVVFMAVLGLFITAHQIEYDQYAINEIQTIANSFIAPGQAVAPAQATPDAVYALGDGISSQISKLATSNNWFANEAMSIYVSWAGFWVQMGFLALALEDLLGRMIIPFAISLVSIFLGCIVCRFTRALSAKWIQVVVSGLIFTIVVDAMIGVGVHVAASILAQANAIDHTDMRTTLNSIASSGLMFFAVVCAVPTIVGVLGGHFAMGRGVAAAATVIGTTTGIYNTVNSYLNKNSGKTGGSKARSSAASLRKAT